MIKMVAKKLNKGGKRQEKRNIAKNPPNLSNTTIKKLAVLTGIKRVNTKVYDYIRQISYELLKRLLTASVEATLYNKKHTIMFKHIELAASNHVHFKTDIKHYSLPLGRSAINGFVMPVQTFKRLVRSFLSEITNEKLHLAKNSLPVLQHIFELYIKVVFRAVEVFMRYIKKNTAILSDVEFVVNFSDNLRYI